MTDEDYAVSDPRHPLNVTDDVYYQRMRERAERVGDAGLHTIPDKYMTEVAGEAR